MSRAPLHLADPQVLRSLAPKASTSFIRDNPAHQFKGNYYSRAHRYNTRYYGGTRSDRRCVKGSRSTRRSAPSTCLSHGLRASVGTCQLYVQAELPQEHDTGNPDLAKQHGIRDVELALAEDDGMELDTLLVKQSEAYDISHSVRQLKAQQREHWRKRLDLFESLYPQGVPPKLISLAAFSEDLDLPSPDEGEPAPANIAAFSSYWTMEIALLNAPFDRDAVLQHLEPLELPSPSSIDLFEEDTAIEWPHHAGIDAWKEVWLQSGSKAQKRQWADIMLSYLRDQSSRTLEFLVVTMVHPLPLPYQVADVLDLTARHMSKSEDPEARRYSIHRLFQLVGLVLRRYNTTFPLSQRTIYLLSKSLGSRPRSTLLRLLEKYGCKMEKSTLLRMAVGFAKDHKGHRKALRVLKKITERSETDDHNIRKICSVLLREAQRAPTFQSYEIVDTLFKMGIQLDLVLYNILLYNASEQGDYEAAWRTYELLQRQDIGRDPFTYATILKLCRRTNDFHAFRKVYAEIRSMYNKQPGTDWEPYLVGEILYSFWAFETSLPSIRQPSLTRELLFYAQHYDLQPLVDLGIIYVSNRQHAAEIQYRRPRSSRETPPVYGPRPAPTTFILATMLFFSVRSEKKVNSVYSLLAKFMARLRARDPLVIPLAAKAFIWDVFLFALGRQRRLITYWPRVMRTMIDPFGVKEPSSTIDLITNIESQVNSGNAHTRSLHVTLSELSAGPKSDSADLMANASDALAASTPRANIEDNTQTQPVLHPTSSSTQKHDDESTRETIAPPIVEVVATPPVVRTAATPSSGFDPSQNERTILPIDRDTGRTFRPATPTIQTWNILIDSYTRNNRPDAAAMIFHLLPAYGREPDGVSWNTLLKSYARSSQSQQVTASLNRMQEKGHKFDMFTLGAMGGGIGRADIEVGRTGLGAMVQGGGNRSILRRKDGGFKDATSIATERDGMTLASGWNAENLTSVMNEADMRAKQKCPGPTSEAGKKPEDAAAAHGQGPGSMSGTRSEWWHE